MKLIRFAWCLAFALVFAPAALGQSGPPPKTPTATTETWITPEAAAKLTDQELVDKYTAKGGELDDLTNKVSLAQVNQLAPGFDQQAYNTLLVRLYKFVEFCALTNERYNRVTERLPARATEVVNEAYRQGWQDAIREAIRVVQSNQRLPAYVPTPSVRCHTEYDGAYGLNTVCQ